MSNNAVTKGNSIYSSRDYIMFYNELNKLRKTITRRDTEDIFIIKYKGYKFNCLPFLLNGTGYFSQQYRSSLTNSIAKYSVTTEPFFISELDKENKIDLGLFDSLLPSLSDMGIRMLGAYQYIKCPNEFIKIIFRGSIEVFEAIILDGNTPQFNYNYKDICNTQAFSYYVSILWLLSLSPMLYQLSIRDLKRRKFDELLESLIPEQSIHFKYISGELSSEELLERYTSASFGDNSSICLREIMSNSSNGKYSGEDLTENEISICKEVYDTYTMNENYRMNMHLSYCFLFDGTYERLNNEVTSKTALLERNNDELDKAIKRSRYIQEELNTANQTIRQQEKEIAELKAQLSSIRSNDDLESEISILKSDIKVLNSENNKLFDERLQLKKTISIQKKQLKSFSSSVVMKDDSLDNLDEVNESSNITSFEDAIEKVKDLRITYVGCDDTSVQSKLNDLGINNISRFNSTQRSLGKCDAVVIFAIRCHHADVYKIEKQIGGRNIPIIYLNCVNVNQMIMSIYDAICC